MKTTPVQDAIAKEVRTRLIETGGRMAQDVGFGRVCGQILLYLYLQDGERSIEDIAGELGVSLAAVSVATRQLETLGVLRRAWKKGDRRRYYRTAENIGAALKQGLLTEVRRKTQVMAAELDSACSLIEGRMSSGPDPSPDLKFLHQRVKRARQLQQWTSKILESPFLGLFTS
jgi:DNA-binding transcriptional regulator GbsR (MarR family)